MSNHAFPVKGTFEQRYDLTPNINNFIGLLQCDLSIEVLDRMKTNSDSDLLRLVASIKDGGDKKQFSYFLLGLALISDGIKHGALESLSPDVKELLKYGNAEFSHLNFPLDQLVESGVTEPHSDRVVRPIKSLAYLAPAVELLQDPALLKGFSRWWLDQIETCYLLRVSLEAKAATASHPKGSRIESRAYLYPKFASSWRHISSLKRGEFYSFLKAFASKSTHAKAILEGFQADSLLKGVLIRSKMGTFSTPPTTIGASGVNQLDWFTTLLDPDEKPRDFAQDEDTKPLLFSPNSPNLETIAPINGAGDLSLSVASKPFLTKSSDKRKRVSAADQEEGEEKGDSVEIFVRPRSRGCLSRGEINQERMRTQNHFDAITRASNLTPLDEEQLNDYDLRQFFSLIRSSSTHQAAKLFLQLVFVTGFNPKHLAELRIIGGRGGNKAEVAKPGIWVYRDSVTIIFKPFLPSQRRDTSSSSHKHFTTLQLELKLSAELLRVFRSRGHGKSGCSFSSAEAWGLTKSPFDMAKQELNHLNQEMGTRLTLNRLANVSYRKFLLDYPESDKCVFLRLVNTYFYLSVNGVFAKREHPFCLS